MNFIPLPTGESKDRIMLALITLSELHKW